MKRYTFLCGAVLFLLLLTAPPTLAAPTGACYITPTGISIADALANPYCLIINLAAGTYKVHGLVVNRDVVIQGAGKTTTIIDGLLAGRVFDLTNGAATVEMFRMTIRNGQAAYSGGAIQSLSKLFVSDMVFSSNKAGSNGAAIYASGPVTSIQRSTFKGNIAGWACGAVYATGPTTIDASIFDSNQAQLGGAVCNEYTNLDITGSTFSNNKANSASAQYGGGAIFFQGPGNVFKSKFTNNTAVGDGGAIYLFEDYQVGIQNSTFTGNKATGAGGAIFQIRGLVNLAGSTLSANSALLGGGITSVGGSLLSVSYSTLSANKAIATVVPTAAGQPVDANGIDLTRPGTAHPTLPSLPLAGSASGGGIFTTISTRLLNSTLSANTTTGYGGGLFVYSPGYVMLSFVTLSGNRATMGGGNIYNTGGVGFRNSIVNAGYPQNCGEEPSRSWGSSGANVSSDFSCTILIGGADKSGINPKLGLLANNGGPTKTHALQLGSPAINFAPDCDDWSSTLIPVDQRLYPRPKPAGGKCDVGAFEK